MSICRTEIYQVYSCTYDRSNNLSLKEDIPIYFNFYTLGFTYTQKNNNTSKLSNIFM